MNELCYIVLHSFEEHSSLKSERKADRRDSVEAESSSKSFLPGGDNFLAHTQHSVVSEERSPGVIKGQMTSLAALVMDNRPMRTPKRRTDALDDPLPEASDIP